MENNIEHLKTEVNEIKQSLNELKNNISFSEIEKKDKADILKQQAEKTKQKIQDEIKILETKTDDTSKMKKEEAETLLNSFNDITVLYNSITNPSLNTGTQSYDQAPVEQNKNIFTKTKEWFGEQRDSIQDKMKRKTEGGKNLLRTLGFAATGVGAIALAYKGIKKLFGWGKDDNKDDDDKEKNDNKEKDNDNNDENNTEANEKTEKKEESKDKWYRKALKWLGIAGATGGGLYAINKGSNLWASERKQGNEKISNESNKEENSDSSNTEKKSENSSDKKESDKQDTKNSTNSNESKEVDKGKNTYTNPISGLTYKRIDQVTDPAGKLRYSGSRSGKTVANIGCLLASGCTVTSALCPEVTLTDCFNNVRHWTADKAVPKMSNNKWKSEALLSGEHGNRTKAQEQKAKEEIIANLKKGYPAVIGARHSGIDGTNDSIVSQHYRAILGIRTENGKNEFFVGNTYKNGSGGWMSEDKIFKNMIHASIFTPNQA